MSAEQAMTDRLSDDDLALLAPAVTAAKVAAADLEQCAANLTAARGAVNYILKHLTPKYGLEAADSIEMDGTIKRANHG